MSHIPSRRVTWVDRARHSYCSIFYNEVTTSRLCTDTSVASRNVRGGTTLHELTHALSGTDDVGYGCAFDMNLGQTNPGQAVRNADNYNVRVYCHALPSGQALITIISSASPPRSSRARSAAERVPRPAEVRRGEHGMNAVWVMALRVQNAREI